VSDEHFTPGSANGSTASDVGDVSTAADPSTTSSVAEEAPAQYGVGPFTIREVSLLGVWLVAFIVSFFSVWVESPVSAVVLPYGSVWASGIDWVLTIGVPTVAVFLIVLRRFSPDGIRRVGSLAVDQFASVAFSVSAVVWLGLLWTNLARAIQTGLWLSSWVVWVEFFLMVAGVFLTVLAPFIQPFDEDFRGRPDVSSHRNARPVRPVTPRPAAEAPTATAYAPSPYAPAEETPTATYGEPAGSDESIAHDTTSDDTSPFSFATLEEPVEAAPTTSQAFWALSPVERDVVDENGLPVFSVGPTAWALVIEDRGDSFVVRHEDGRVGYLTDISGVTRG